MAREFTLNPAQTFMEDKERYVRDGRLLKKLAKVEMNLRKSGLLYFKKVHQIDEAGPDVWTIYLDQGRRLLVQSVGEVIHLLHVGEHDDVYRAAARAAGKGYCGPPLLESAGMIEALSAPLELFADVEDELLRRLGVPSGAMSEVRRCRQVGDVWSLLERLGEDLTQRLLDCLERPAGDVLADYELRGKDDASVELLARGEQERHAAVAEAVAEATSARVEQEKDRLSLAIVQDQLEIVQHERDTLRSESIGMQGADAATEARVTKMEIDLARLQELAEQANRAVSEAEQRSEAAEQRAALAESAALDEANKVRLVARKRASPPRSSPTTPAPRRSAETVAAAPRAPMDALSGPFTLHLVDPDVTDRRTASGLKLSQVLGRAQASTVARDLLRGRKEGGRVWVHRDGRVSSRRGAAQTWMLVGRVTADQWFPGVVDRPVGTFDWSSPVPPPVLPGRAPIGSTTATGTVTAVGTRLWGLSIRGALPQRFRRVGWSFDGFTGAPCPDCGTSLAALRKPMSGGNRGKRYWALVCTACAQAITPQDLGPLSWTVALAGPPPLSQRRSATS